MKRFLEQFKRDKKGLRVPLRSKKIVIIGGSKGSGKHFLAKMVQASLEESIIISKNDTSSILRRTLLDIYGKLPHQTNTTEYTYKVEPLEYEQLVSTCKHIVEVNRCSVILVGRFFSQLADASWIDSLKTYASSHVYDLELIYLNRDKETPSSKRTYVRENFTLRRKIDCHIASINENTAIKKIKTSQIY